MERDIVEKEERVEKPNNAWKFIVMGLLAALLMIAVVYASAEKNKAEAAERKLNDNYQSAFNRIVGGVSDIDTALGKLMVMNGSAQHSSMLTSIWGKCVQVQSLMGQIPLGHPSISELSQFIARVGDFSLCCNNDVVNGTELTEEQKAQLAEISETSTVVLNSLRDLQDSGGPEFSRFDEEEGFYGDASDVNIVGLEEYPRLIYDGPFSESTENKEPEGLEDREVDANAALAIAEEFLQGSISGLEQTEEILGDLAAWVYKGMMGEREAHVAVTKKGGHMLWMSTDSTGEDMEIPEERAIELAEIAGQYLAERGFETEPTYSQHYAGKIIANMAYTENGIIVYPDLIKVWVDEATGEIIGFDFRNYLMSHKERGLSTEGLLSVEEARALVSPNLEVENEGRLALIPLKMHNTEELCYEFSGFHGEKRFLVYVNAQSGKEEDVLVIIDTENGTLVE